MDARVYIGIGSNMGDRKANIDKAMGLLKEIAETEVVSASALYKSLPVGGPPDQGDFLNGAVLIKTSINPLELLNKLKYIEHRLGRPKNAERNAPRTIDLDILLYNDLVVKGENIQIPHPRLAERRFVLEPLCEISPDLLHPESKKTVRQLLEDLDGDRIPLDR
ncbi:MAG: 2-amino-4-hydroxy-6-hydroxymethyldihydropteridine diphosphokinase [Candidatus Omnitrophica bacterium CG1_02_49_10]|nr:MAG: 2-amino-4-hydroxy-6-hydroxymethyldihydropteridine diphosphokinase [Candidatus Omnitrophica bacterium CG1_02_49_10]